MNFTYEIQTIIPAEQRAFVVYTLDDQPNNPKGAWIYVNTHQVDPEAVRQNAINGFPAHLFENEEFTLEDIEEALAGVKTGAATYITPMSSPADIASFQLSRRNLYLQDTDWTQLPDASLSPEYVQAYKVYRQLLRDLPEDPSWPLVSFPMPEVHMPITAEMQKAYDDWQKMSSQYSELNTGNI